MTLREKYFEALSQSQTKHKTLMGKSAVDPQLVALRNEEGSIVGYGEAEHVPLSDPHHPSNRHDVSKGADLNDCLDDFFPFGDEASEVVEIEKSVTVYDEDDAVLFSVFPPALQPS